MISVPKTTKVEVWEAVIKGYTLMPEVDEWMEVRAMLVDLLNVFVGWGCDEEAIEVTHHIGTMDEMYGWCPDE